ncbi:MAG TPA: thiamine phosphate synthase [Puia sp.]|nr:thiamine phosphate synthase [Puia sp.]
MALSRLYFVTMDRVPGVTDGAVMAPLGQVEAACRAGIRLIQLRMKEASDEEFLMTARDAMKICRAWGSRLIINDRVAVAAAVDADGVHVGQEDLPVREARRMLGKGKIVGGTANTMGDIREHYKGGADYIGLGPYRYTTTKKKLSPILGLEGYSKVVRQMDAEGISVPIYAIGGIGVEDVGGLVGAGVYGVAFSGMLVRAADRARMVTELLKQFRYVEDSR